MFGFPDDENSIIFLEEMAKRIRKRNPGTKNIDEEVKALDLDKLAIGPFYVEKTNLSSYENKNYKNGGIKND